MMKQTAHIEIGGRPLCTFQVPAFTPRIIAATGEFRCDFPSMTAAKRYAQAIRPVFQRGRVKVVPGPCPEFTA